MSICDKVKALGETFRGRLSDDLLDAALQYVDFNECGIALETIGDYICETDLPISEEEYEGLLAMAQELGLDRNAGRYRYMKTLVRG